MTTVRLPLAILGTIVSGLLGAGTVYGVMSTTLDNTKKDLAAVQQESRYTDLRLEKRIEKIEDAMKILERIDERTKTTNKTLIDVQTRLNAHMDASGTMKTGKTTTTTTTTDTTTDE
jgi:hypothetical protein